LIQFALIRLVFISMSLVSPLAMASAQDWETRKVEDGITVQSRLPENAKYQEFRADTEIDATIAQAIALLSDNEACPEWLYRCKESRLIKEISPTERIFYQVSSLPFPAKSREAVFHAKIRYNTDHSALIEMTAATSELAQTKHLRIAEAIGTYILEPLPNNRTRITWQLYVDPGGALPAWLVNAMLTDLPFKSLQAFRILVRRPPYSQAEFVYDGDGQPIDIVFTRP
jgi:hypothetical protein